MKRKSIDLSLITSLIFGIILFICGCVFLLCNFEGEILLGFYPITLYIFAFVSCLSYFVARKEGDYEYLLQTLIYVMCASIVYIFADQGNLVLSSSLSVFTFLFMLNRLLKIRYLRSINSFMWIVKAYGTFLVVVLGILTSYNLYNSISISRYMLGYFNITFSIIVTIEALCEMFISESKFKRFILKLLKVENKLENVSEVNNKKSNKKKTKK